MRFRTNPRKLGANPTAESAELAENSNRPILTEVRTSGFLASEGYAWGKITQSYFLNLVEDLILSCRYCLIYISNGI